MKTYKLKSVQKLPISLNDAWDFFSSPVNLKEITPAEMNFTITSEHTKEDKIYAGQIITYIVRPLMGIPLRWMTEITHVKDKEYFVDEQRFGPFALWQASHASIQRNNRRNRNDGYGTLRYSLWYSGTMGAPYFGKRGIEENF
jgi:ligand-binding SRPBCC domain-containing protein